MDLPATLLAALIAFVASAAQDPGGKPPPTPPPAPPLPGAENPAAVDPAIAALVPGALPADAAPEAREAWQRIAAATCVPNAARAPIKAFELGLDVLYRKSDAEKNQLDAVYKFLAPDFVRIDLKNRSTMRGPGGDWLEDRARGEKVDLRVGREHAEDRRQLDETASVARHFIALSNPGGLRIASLEKLAGPPAGLPKAKDEKMKFDLEKRAPQLAWLRIKSPDFRLVGSGATAPMSRATIGYDPQTARVEIALVEEDRPGPALAPSARLVRLAESLEAQGYAVPKRIYVYSTAQGPGAPPGFATEPSMDLYVVRANLAPTLAAQDFVPK